MRIRESSGRFSGRAACLAAVAGLAVASAAHGQVRNWNNAAGGNWSLAANWNPADVPNTTGESAAIALAGSYAITLDSTLSIGAYSNSNPTAVLNIPAGITLSTAGGLTNDGVMTLNPSGANVGTTLRMISSQTLSGSGQVVLNANPANLDTALVYWNGGGEVLTHAAGHTIRGTGRIWVRTTNAGLIDADVSGKTLQLGGGTKTNTGTMRARNGGTLQVSTDVTNTGGTIGADGGTVTFDSVTLAGGAVDAINGGLVSINGFTIFNTVTMSGPTSVQAGGNLRVSGPLTNNGVITVNPSAVNTGTQFSFGTSQPVTGTGQIVLNANPANLDTALVYWNGGGEVFTQGASHTVRGTGRISTIMVNNGTVSADQAGKMLQLVSGTKTNNALMQATGGGTLELNGITVNQGPAGQILTSGASSLLVTSSVINDGVVSTPAPGLTTVNGASIFNDVVFTGGAQVSAGGGLRTAAGFTNNGTITVNPLAANVGTYAQCINSCTIDGSGTIALNASPLNIDTAYIYWNGGGEVLTQGAAHTIRGVGRVYVSMINNGTVRADVSGRSLELMGANKTNNATMTATSGGNLAVNSIALTQGGAGSLSTSGGGTISVSNSTITGGAINTSAGGPATIANSTVNGVTVTGSVLVAPNTTMSTAASGITNNGTITINPTADNFNTFLQFVNSATVNGNGSIVLNARAGNLDSAYLYFNGGGEVFTNAAGHTVRGTGRIYVSTQNNGIISADVAGRPLELNSVTKTNNALIRATAGGQLQYTSFTMNQTATGRTVAEAGSTWVLTGTAVNGGRMEVNPGGTGTYSSGNTLDSVTLIGAQSIATGATLRVTSGGITNNGDLTNNGVLQAVTSFTLGGTGRVILTAPANNLDASYIYFNGGGELVTNGTDHTVAGRGRVYTRFDNAGTISPGATAGQSATIDFRNPLTFTSTGLLDIEIGGDTEFDTITSASTVALGNGRLRVRTYNAYTPNYNQTFDILTCTSRSGVFADVDAPGFQVEYLADRVRLRVICDGDFNQDGNVDQGDVDFLINVIAGGGSSPFLSPDFNRDGNVDQGDIDALINVIAGGACQQ